MDTTRQKKYSKKIIVTIPAYNEANTIGTVLKDIHAVMKENHYNYQILVVDDGSKDNTATIARKLGAVVTVHPKNYGLAETFRTEMKRCIELGADIIVHTDADGQYLARDIPKLIEKVEEGYNLVLGSRFKGKIESMPIIKRLGNRAFSRVISSVSGFRVSDAQTGFRAFTKDLANSLVMTSNHTYTQEQIIRAVREKFTIAEIPIYFAKRGHGKSKLMKNPFEYAAKAWINILRIYRDYQPLKFFGLFGLFFFGIGFLIGLWILATLLQTGTVGALPRVMLSVLFISIGIQIWLFGFLADMRRS